MSTPQEREYIKHLMGELREDFERYAKEYQQPRDLGALGEFANLYRKARKLKTLMWPGENQSPGVEWREDLRTIVKEVVSHGLLLLTDLDKQSGRMESWRTDEEEEDEELDEDDPLRKRPPRRRRVAARQFGARKPA